MRRLIVSIAVLLCFSLWIAAQQPPVTASFPGTVIPADHYLSFETEDHEVSAYIYDESDNPLGKNFFVNSGYKTITIGGAPRPFLLFLNPTEDPPANRSNVFIEFKINDQFHLKQIQVGAPDSGGPGYRALRVLN